MSTTVAIHIGSQNSAACYGENPIIPLICQDHTLLNNVISYSSGQPRLQLEKSIVNSENTIRYPLRLFDLALNNVGGQKISDIAFGSPVVQYNQSLYFHLANGSMKSCDDAILDIMRFIYNEAFRLSNEIDSLSLTIPSYYSYEMRDRLNKCIQRAGITSRGLFTEAECLVLDKLYSQDKYWEEKSNYFVLHIGAVVCEGSFIKVSEGQLTEYPIFFERNLGGEKVDELLLNFCDNKLKQDGIDIYEGNKKENKKKRLEYINLAKEIYLDDECIEFPMTKGSQSVDIDAEQYIEILKPVIDTIKKSIVNGFALERDRMEDPDISIDKVTKVICLGELLTKQPAFQNEIMKLFSVAPINCGVNQELEGCLRHLRCEKSKAMKLLHPLNFSIGIGLDNNRAKRIISAGSLLPAKSSLIWRQNGLLKNELNTAIFCGDMFISMPLLDNLKRLLTIREKSADFVTHHLFRTMLEVSTDGVLTISILNMKDKELYRKSIMLTIY